MGAPAPPPTVVLKETDVLLPFSVEPDFFCTLCKDPADWAPQWRQVDVYSESWSDFSIQWVLVWSALSRLRGFWLYTEADALSAWGISGIQTFLEVGGSWIGARNPKSFFESDSIFHKTKPTPPPAKNKQTKNPEKPGRNYYTVPELLVVIYLGIKIYSEFVFVIKNF